MGIKILIHGNGNMGTGIDQWECEGMGILIVFPHTSRTAVAQHVCQSIMHSLLSSFEFLASASSRLASHTQQLHSISVNHSPNPNPNPTNLPLHKSAECTKLLLLCFSLFGGIRKNCVIIRPNIF